MKPDYDAVADRVMALAAADGPAWAGDAAFPAGEGGRKLLEALADDAACMVACMLTPEAREALDAGEGGGVLAGLWTAAVAWKTAQMLQEARMPRAAAAKDGRCRQICAAINVRCEPRAGALEGSWL